jgi:PKHD-type hydroxylase
MENLINSPKLDIDISHRANRTNGYWGFRRPKPDYWAWADIFSYDECESIIEIGKNIGLVSGESGFEGISDYRRSNISFMFPSAYTEWIFYRLEHAIENLNTFFGFEIDGMGEGIQFTEYNAPDGHYNWHCDVGEPANVRKLSITVELSDPNDFEGGQLELNPTGKIAQIDKVRGRATAFPSYMLHRVTPVTSGTRYSLVVWVAGPPFK